MSLICVTLATLFTWPLDGSEFSGGRVTGPLLDMANLGLICFVIAAILSFVRGVPGAVASLIGCLLTFPIYFYFVLPGPFRRIFRGEYSVPPRSYFAWNFNSALGLLALTLAAVVSLGVLLTRPTPQQNSH
jgi:hypothetical protein